MFDSLARVRRYRFSSAKRVMVSNVTWSFFLHARYTNNYVTDAEMASLSARGQEQVKRAAQAHQGPGYAYGGAAVGPIRCRRVGECMSYVHGGAARLKMATL